MAKKRVLLVVLALTFGFVFAGCAGLSNLLNPIYAINSNGEKVEADWGSGQIVKIEGSEYPYKDRPTVPAAPQKPVSPGNPPSKPAMPTPPTGTITYPVGGGKVVTENWSNGEELRQIMLRIPDENMKSQYEQYSRELEQYNANLSTYQNRIVTHQQNTAKYQQNVAEYNKNIAEYQAKLPEYTAEVEAETKAIQDSINPNAPSNWDKYVTEKYLLYRGK
jgi:uncharacterized membrane-anchored protein YhcB (DUF1043 family)